MQCVTASIDKQALIDNVKHIRSLVPNSKIIAVVKANAYGHGLFPVANALKDHADAFAVARISEAMAQIYLPCLRKRLKMAQGMNFILIDGWNMLRMAGKKKMI